MNLCSSGHDEICHEGRDCPLCAHIKESKETISELESKIDELKGEINDLTAET